MMANARHTKNVPGRETGMKTGEWIADLPRHGIGREALSTVYRGHTRNGPPLPMARSGACDDGDGTSRSVNR